MNRLICTIAVLVIASNAFAAKQTIHNFEHVLGSSRAKFTQLCKSEGGVVSTQDNDFLYCAFEEADKADVSVQLENGRVTIFGMLWAGPSAGLAMLKTLRTVYGKEDFSGDDDGCRQFLWIAREGFSFTVLVCSEKSLVIVERN